MLGQRNEIAWLQSDFYRDQYRKTLRWIMITLALIYVLLAIIAYVILFQAPIKYYANTSTGMILSMPQPAVG
jgi:hypothetical protein